MGSRVILDERKKRQSRRNIKIPTNDSSKKERSLRLRKLAKILKKSQGDRSEEEIKFLEESSYLISFAESRLAKAVILNERNIEKEDSFELLKEKCDQLVQDIRQSKYMIVYTGAGISTSANIPDYRGPNGVWTRLNRDGKTTDVPLQDLVCAEPTFTHMALAELYRQRIVKHVVSQNCDGLHVRSGLPCDILSEVHGNMFAEFCSNCNKLYWRDFDVTEKTGFHRHRTGRYCHNCPTEVGKLLDTIVHFNEKAHSLKPYNWELARQAAQNADIILCLGTSLKVLRRYPCLWPKKHSNKPKLYIVNLQWTPKDSQATLKINGKCDTVMRTICHSLFLRIPEYKKSSDPLLNLSVPLKTNELSTCNRIHLSSCPKNSQDNQKTSSDSTFQPGWFGKGLKAKKK